jgi:hypothetical protein
VFLSLPAASILVHADLLSCPPVDNRLGEAVALSWRRWFRQNVSVFGTSSYTLLRKLHFFLNESLLTSSNTLGGTKVQIDSPLFGVHTPSTSFCMLMLSCRDLICAGCMSYLCSHAVAHECPSFIGCWWPSCSIPRRQARFSFRSRTMNTICHFKSDSSSLCLQCGQFLGSERTWTAS